MFEIVFGSDHLIRLRFELLYRMDRKGETRDLVVLLNKIWLSDLSLGRKIFKTSEFRDSF